MTGPGLGLVTGKGEQQSNTGLVYEWGGCRTVESSSISPFDPRPPRLMMIIIGSHNLQN